MPVSQAGPSKYQRVPDGYWILDTGQEIFAIANAVQTPVSLLIVRKQIYIVCYIVSQINTITNIGVNVGRKKAQGSAHLECILGRYIADIWKVQDDHGIIIMTSSTIIMIIMTVKVGLVRPRPWNNRDVWCSGALVADR